MAVTFGTTSENGTGRGPSPPRLLLAVPNVTGVKVIRNDTVENTVCV